MKSESIHVCKVLALLASVLIHVFFLSHSGVGNSSAAFPKSELRLMQVSFVADEVPVELCANTGKCDISQQGGRLVEEGDAPKKVGTTPSPVVNVTAQVNHDPFLGLGTSYYFPKNELSHPPRILTNPHIRLPDDDDPRIIGSVKLRLFLSENGQIDDLVIVETSLPENYVDAIKSGYKQVLFAPGELNGKPVKSQLDFEINFTTDQTQLPILRQNH